MTSTNAETRISFMSTLSKRIWLRRVASISPPNLSLLNLALSPSTSKSRVQSLNLRAQKMRQKAKTNLCPKNSGIPPWQEFPTVFLCFQANIESVIWMCDIQQAIQSYFLRSHNFEFNRTGCAWKCNGFLNSPKTMFAILYSPSVIHPGLL